MALRANMPNSLVCHPSFLILFTLKIMAIKSWNKLTYVRKIFFDENGGRTLCQKRCFLLLRIPKTSANKTLLCIAALRKHILFLGKKVIFERGGKICQERKLVFATNSNLKNWGNRIYSLKYIRTTSLWQTWKGKVILFFLDIFNKNLASNTLKKMYGAPGKHA